MSNILKTAILGASGYTGVECVRLILGHPNLELTALSAHSRAGEVFGEVFPSYAGMDLPRLQKWDEINWDDIDVAFACLPHGASQDTIAQILPRVGTVIDLSADFRLRDPKVYESTYGRSHDATDILKDAVYGLTEFARDKLPGAKLVACPGCYPTAALLTLIPAAQSGLIDLDDIIIDAKSGATGAGRKATLGLSFTELAEGAQAYGVGTHRHAPEIDQILQRVSGQAMQVSFTPHLLPMNRGEIVTIYAKLAKGQSAKSVRQAYAERYADEPFVHVEAKGVVPQTRHVRGSNHCRIGIFSDRRADRVILIGVIDNLVKGSSGQAVQNLNVVMGWDETTGLGHSALFP
ncbi:N-acetyl-gamma-glutamyl-phosphate reductase [Robiginitomaculum antarcticum]|uniref:N-acetyl-gamma-glutamyl-phosphate reductase n=1 Tax=Robiginitomaculum antarcticum TaxID=437507 RepID=UPI00036C3D03|nr:N-acetyl-gamma-glutamyl-phosphate reductase [Robiginitomaculum antarcticum]